MDRKCTLNALTLVLLGLALTPGCSADASERALVQASILISKAHSAASLSLPVHSTTRHCVQVMATFSFGGGTACSVQCTNVVGRPCSAAYGTRNGHGMGAYVRFGEVQQACVSLCGPSEHWAGMLLLKSADTLAHSVLRPEALMCWQQHVPAMCASISKTRACTRTRSKGTQEQCVSVVQVVKKCSMRRHSRVEQLHWHGRPAC